MAEKGDDLEPEKSDFKAPAQKTLEEIKQADQDDPSLVEYKKKLLGTEVAPVFPDNPKNVIVEKIQIEFVDDASRQPVELRLLGANPAELKKSSIIIKEGVNYRVKIFFFVQREIVSGLRYVQATYKMGIRASKDDLMVGSYPPKSEAHVFNSPVQEAPSGMLARGSYSVKSRFTDDDKHDYLTWEWGIKIKENWKD